MSLLNLRDGEQRLTVESSYRAVGQWVRVIPGDKLAILIKSSGTGLLIRYAGNVGSRGAHHHYQTVSLEGVALVPVTFRPLPNWLADQVANARAGRRVVGELHAAVFRIVNGTPPPEPTDEELYLAYCLARGAQPDAEDRAYLSRVFEGVQQLEERFQEAQQLQAELDAVTQKGAK
jgi:hypothetical protein